MREILDIEPGRDGWVRHYRFSGYVHRMHRHRELEVNLVTRGRATYLMAGRQRYDLRRGTQIWLFPGQDHVLVDQSDDCQMWIVVFRPEMVRRVATAGDSRVLRRADPPGQFARQLAAGDASRLAALFDELSGLVDAADAPRFNAGLTYAMLTAWHAHQNADELAAGQEVHPAVERAARLIRDEVEPMSLAELAEHCGLSPSRLSRVFREQTGVALVVYRQKMCLERFLKIYGNGRRKSMMTAALEAGFGSYPQFHRVFKQHMRRSPAQHRRENLGEEGES
jgi:AraC-like DNA-binding protein